KGIGAGIAKAFIEAGAKVVLNCNSNRAMADELLAKYHADYGEDSCILVQADVSEYAQAEGLIQAAVDQWGRLDILVNNAALQKNTPFDGYSEENYDLLMKVNLGGYTNMMRAALPELKKTKGNIILISSVHGKRATDFDPVYAMTKGGMHMLMREAAVEFAQYGVRVNMIQPAAVQIEFKTGVESGKRATREPRHAYIDSKMLNEKYPLYALGRTGLPKDDAYACVYMASDEAEHLTGASLRVDGGSMLK
ncbi:MAG: SDR family oxidoreductase, partial [Christensenellaceae bacterium]|nr:SDR family oxidoreductase [Christensenellaceae bacterium]